MSLVRREDMGNQIPSQFCGISLIVELDIANVRATERYRYSAPLKSRRGRMAMHLSCKEDYMGSTPFACSMFKRRNLFKSLLGLFLVPNIPIVPRKLETTWSFEAEDLVCLHGEFADSTIVSLMAKEIQEEIDNEMISRMIAESKKMPM